MDRIFSFGEWVRRRRKALGLTRQALAEQAGYSAAMIRKIEDDERRPSQSAAALLAKALEIPQDQQDAFLKVARQESAVDQMGRVDHQEPFPWLTAAHPRTNLPVPTTLFIGREEESERLVSMLQDPSCRLVTLIGLAGIGKTRLAIQVARSQLDRFEHGVFFVSLASLPSHNMIVAAIANAIGFQFYGTAQPEEQLLHYLQEKHMILVLDNFEHLIEGTELFPKILQDAPRIKILVTSRERLNLQGEWLFEVEGLPYPLGPKVSSLEQLDEYEAVQLFLQGALRVNPGFNLDETNREWVVRICQLTEGIPLGIELAAAWARVLSCQTIAREIERSLDFLKASAKDIPERHRSLRAALDHSWQLLSEREKEVFPRLSVFRGGFQIEAAQYVAGANLEDITSLLDKSLLKRVGEERYDLHELIRQYGDEVLASNPHEDTETRDRHSSYYAALLKQWEWQVRSPKQVEILAEMDAKMDNVRLAWSWMAARLQIDNIQKSLGSLWHFHEIRGLLREGATLFSEAVSTLEKSDDTTLAQEAERQAVLGHVLAHQGYFLAHLDMYEQADKVLQRSLALLRFNTDRSALAEALAYRAYLKYRQGEFKEASQYALESLALNRASSDQIGIVFCLITLSFISLAQGAYEQAHKLSSESLAITRDILDDPHGTADSLIILSAALRHLGQFTQAKRLARESLEISKSLNDRWIMAQTLRQLGLISLELGETRRAQILIRQSVSQSREIGDRSLIATALIGLGVVTATCGAPSEAKRYFLEALRIAMEMKTPIIALESLVEIATIEMRAGATEKALELVSYCLQNPVTRSRAINRAERLRLALVAQLTQQQIKTVQRRVLTQDLESLVDEVLASGSTRTTASPLSR